MRSRVRPHDTAPWLRRPASKASLSTAARRSRASRVRRDLRVVWLLPAVAFLVALLATGSVEGGSPPLARPAAAPAGAHAPSRERPAAPPTPILADVPELPAPLASPAARRRSRVVLARRPAPRRAAPTAVPSPAPEVPAASAPSPRRPAPAPQPVAPAPQPVAPAPAPAPVTPAPEFDDSGSGPAFNDDGVSP